MTDLYARPPYSPDTTPSMGRQNVRWHDEKSVQSFINRSLETGWLVKVEPVAKYHAVPNDLIGGWDVSEHNKPVSEHEHDKGQHTIGSFMSKEDARWVAKAMNLLAAVDNE